MDGFIEFARAGSHRRRGSIRSSDYPKKGYILTLLLHSLHFQWTSRPQEANCRHRQFGTQTDGATPRTEADQTARYSTLRGIHRPRKSHRARLWRTIAGAVAQERAGS